MRLQKQDNVWKILTVLSAIVMLTCSISFIKYFPRQGIYGQIMCYNTDSTLVRYDIGYIYYNQSGKLYLNDRQVSNNCIIEQSPFSLYTPK